ncbi:MAG: hypothetical protein ACRDOJ_11940 [Nocardioidaceae bacterium]
MAVLIVPRLDDEPWPSLGGQVCDLIEERAVFGPGSLKGKPAQLDAEKRAAIWRAYEVYPKKHPLAGRRRFKRVGWSWRKATAKTEAMAWLAFVELHPEGPVRCDGFDAHGQPVGRPVVDPYIPMVAYTEEQTELLAYGALYVVITECGDADLFDVGMDRILRLDGRGRADGRCEALSGSPNANDGARTTFQCFDEVHRMYLPRLLEAHETMLGNLPKRPLEDPWSLETTTAGQPGQGSVAEKTHTEALAIERGEVEEPDLFYFHREAGPGHDLKTLEGRIAAVAEATGPVGEYAPGQFRDIARQWDRRGADKAYLERVWLNRWTRSSAQAFDPARVDADRDGNLLRDAQIAPGAFVVAGFDGARFRDSTGIVVTEVATGLQRPWALWERPLDAPADWEVDEAAVTESVEQLMGTYEVWRFNADPPHWTETVGSWSGRWPCVEEWWTTRRWVMARAVRAYVEAMDAAAVTYTADDPLMPGLARHIGNAGRRDTGMRDDDGQPLFLLAKLHEDRKFDLAMAAVLSWEARLAALRKNARSKKRRKRVIRRLS